MAAFGTDRATGDDDDEEDDTRLGQAFQKEERWCFPFPDVFNFIMEIRWLLSRSQWSMVRTSIQ